MIKELAAFGKKIREDNSMVRIIHDSIKEEFISTEILIREDGSFYGLEPVDKVTTIAEAILAKKGKARLLLDKSEEALRFDTAKEPTEKSQKETKKKYIRFLEKIELFKELRCLAPILLFYGQNCKDGVDKACLAFSEQKDNLSLFGNIAFRLVGENERINEKKEVIDSIISRFETAQKKLIKNSVPIKCSVCNNSTFPVIDQPHGAIKKIPKGQSAGNALISYNETAFESYGLKGNLNSSICSNCARLYVEGLNELLSSGKLVEENKKKYFKYEHRKDLGIDTAVIYWTRDNQKVSEIDFLEEPKEELVGELIKSLASGNENVGSYTNNDLFYSCTLSSAAARIAVRDWIEISLSEYKRNIARWFEDIKIISFNDVKYSSLYGLAHSTVNKKVKKDTTQARVAVHLWNAALKGNSPPLWILSLVLKRIRFVESNEDKNKIDTFTKERAALIRLILNRNPKKGGYMFKEKLDSINKTPAYVSGRIFAVLENIQRAALGKDINAGIRERFFSFASTTPSPAFGRLIKMSQNHLSKLRSENPGYATNLDKELQELCAYLDEFPVTLSLEEQGQFALGYYHQKHDSIAKATEKKNSQIKEEEN